MQIQAQTHGCFKDNYYAETPTDYQQGKRTGSFGVGYSVIDIYNQTPLSESVLLTGMHVLVQARKPTPSTGIVVADGQCGGPVDVRPFTADLDQRDQSVPVIA